MAKTHSQYVCQQCGYSQVGWAGKCPSCGSWGSLVETIVSAEHRTNNKERRTEILKPVSLSSVSSQKTKRISTKISELDRVLGGGLVPGQVVLIAGEPGIGKSTILIQMSEKMGNVLYVSGEESLGQIKIHAQRLGIKDKKIQILEGTNIDSIIEVARKIKNLDILIVDSIQTMYTSNLSGMAGSVGQVRESAFRLVKFAKKSHVPTLMVGHITKEGSVAGPAVLAHIVDTVLWFEGDNTQTLRILRANKNRFGPTDEVGIFTMQESGLVPIDNTGNLFLSKTQDKISGSVITSIMQGTRPILVEIQSLVIPSKLAFPRRIAQGIDPKRLELILAVLARRCGVNFFDFDVFVNVVGGIAIRETGADLAVSLSLLSSRFDKPLPKLIVVGEVGLLGEIREVIAQDKRLKEAKRLGHKKFISNNNFRFLREAVKAYFS